MVTDVTPEGGHRKDLPSWRSKDSFAFLTKQSPNEWRWFCACLNSCILWRALDVLCAIPGQRVWFIFWFLALCWQLRRCLIFFNDFVRSLFDFLVPIPHFCTFCIVQVFLGATSWFPQFSWSCFASFCAPDFFMYWFSNCNLFCVVCELFLIL